MQEFRKVLHEAYEVAQTTCNKCGAEIPHVWIPKEHSEFEVHPGYTTIRHKYGYGSKKDGDEYISHICEPCMDLFYATLMIPPQVVSMYGPWGNDLTTAAPVAPAVEEHASVTTSLHETPQEKASKEP